MTKGLKILLVSSLFICFSAQSATYTCFNSDGSSYQTDSLPDTDVLCFEDDVLNALSIDQLYFELEEHFEQISENKMSQKKR